MGAHIGLTEALSAYVIRHTRESDVARRLREETSTLPGAQMLTSPDQAHFLALLVQITGARRIIEIGTFTGYSALAMAEVLPEDGHITTCDIHPETTAIAKRYWAEAGVGHKVTLQLAPALQTLSALQEEGKTYDLVFIDADKGAYDHYYEAALMLLKPSGLVVLDNMLWRGTVAEPHSHDKQAPLLQTLNAKIAVDTRVDASLLTLADGMIVARKR